ncbi:MAG: carbohydrate ABC transporter permease [Lachnospiraceae bacterium]|nr:carbohydrate ABC transporter permease [Lachnospiraceae bacterium]
MELGWRQTASKKIAKVPVKRIAEGFGKIFLSCCRYLILIGISYLMIYPVLTMLAQAFSNPMDLYNETMTWIPKNPTFMNFTNAVESYFDYFKHLKITLSAALISTGLSLIVCPLAAYGQARYRFKGNGLLFALVILTIIVPIQTAQIPLYLEYQEFDFFGLGTLIGKITGKPLVFNLLNTNWVYYVPAAFGVGLYSGLYIFLFRQFFKGMPKDLEDAGKVDGCTRLGIYLRIIAPNAKPVFVTVFLLSMINYWNDTVISGMFLNSTEAQPLMIYVDILSSSIVERSSVFGLYGVMGSQAEIMACLVMVVGPLMILFIICQKFFVESMDRSGIKG